jgi:hypothetical protein
VIKAARKIDGLSSDAIVSRMSFLHNRFVKHKILLNLAIRF